MSGKETKWMRTWYYLDNGVSCSSTLEERVMPFSYILGSSEILGNQPSAFMPFFIQACLGKSSWNNALSCHFQYPLFSLTIPFKVKMEHFHALIILFYLPQCRKAKDIFCCITNSSILQHQLFTICTLFVNWEALQPMEECSVKNSENEEINYYMTKITQFCQR